MGGLGENILKTKKTTIKFYIKKIKKMENLEEKIHKEENKTAWDRANELPEAELKDFKEETMEEFYGYVKEFTKEGEEPLYLIIIGDTLAYPKKFKSKEQAENWIGLHPLDIAIKTAIIAMSNNKK